jgi:hypothetical protein
LKRRLNVRITNNSIYGEQNKDASITSKSSHARDFFLFVFWFLYRKKSFSSLRDSNYDSAIAD